MSATNGRPVPLSEETTATMKLGALFAKSRDQAALPMCNVGEVLHNHVPQDTQILKRLRDTLDTQDTHRNPPCAVPARGGLKDEEEDRREEIEFASRSSTSLFFEQHRNLNFNAFLSTAYEFAHNPDDDIPDWFSTLFLFTRLASGHSEMDAPFFQRKPDAAFKMITTELAKWTKTKIGKGEKPPFGAAGDHWMNWFGTPNADAKTEFFDVWNKLRFRPGQTPLLQAFKRARQCRLLLPEKLDGKRPMSDRKLRPEDDYEFFVSLAGWLQVIVGDKTILLPCHRLDKLLKVSHMTISRWTRWAIEDGFLRMEQKSVFSKQYRAAAVYRFNTSMYPATRTAVQDGTNESFFHCNPAANWNPETSA